MNIMTENEMEEHLQDLGYDIMDSHGDDACIDSTIVCDIACCELGFESNMDDDGIITFKADWL